VKGTEKIAIRVAKQDYDRFNELMNTFEGKTKSERFSNSLQAIDSLSK